MIFVGIIGLLLSFAGYRIAFPDRERADFRIFLALLAFHVASSMVYWQLVEAFGGDANTYYHDLRYMMNRSLASGTVAVTQFVQVIKVWTGATQPDFYLLFQAMGFTGLCLLLRSFNEIADDLGVKMPWIAYAVLFLPGLHYWTSAIGKDAPVFMAISMAVWASMRIERRLVVLALAMLIMLAIRPHVGGVTVIALLLSSIFDRRTSALAKVAIGILAAICTVYVISEVKRVTGIENLNAETLADYGESREGIGKKFEGGAAILDLPFPLRVASLLFRPLFFDAEGTVQLIASLENLAWLFIFGTILLSFRMLSRLGTSLFFVRFSLLFAAGLINMLANGTYNVGLGIRQKMMAMPAVLIIFVTIRLYKLALKRRAEAEEHNEELARGAHADGAAWPAPALAAR